MKSALTVTASQVTPVMGFYIRILSSLGNNPTFKPGITIPVQDFSTGVNKLCALFFHANSFYFRPLYFFVCGTRTEIKNTNIKENKANI